MSVTLSGIGVSRGIAIGKVHILERGQPEVIEQKIPESKVEDEVLRFQLALKAAQEELKNIRTRIPASTPADIAEFIDTHLLMLKDSALGDVPIDLIRNQQLNAEWALKLQRDTLVNIFEEMDDAYLRTRKDDVIHVVNRILRILLNQDNQPHDGVTALTGHIIIADDLTPADTILLQHQKIAAFVTEYGGPLSHTAIMARSLHIPAVVGVHNSRKTLHNDEIVIVDGKQGVILANIDEDILSYYRQQQQQESIYYKSLNKLKDKAAITMDGSPISLLGNIELPEDIDSVNDVSASGVGLFRTEFLFMNRSSLPDEEEQLDSYLTVINRLKGNPLTIRTLDLGADKQSQETKGTSIPTINPALGLRAIRLCLKDPDLFMPQLRAILRASAHGPIRLMIPMLSNIQEVLQTLQIIEEAKRQLDKEGLDYDKDIPVGGMIEIPAAAITAYTFAKHLDFLSIGTNDLIQYTLAIDRMDDEVNYLYNPLHPAVLRLIHLILNAGHKAKIPISMCGEMAGDSYYTRLLLGLGLREFSMQAATLLEVKSIIKKSNISELVRPARKVLQCTHSDQALALVNNINAD